MTQSFSDLPLDPLVLEGVQDMQFKEMTPIQAQAIPAALKGRDVIGAAQTGTGKTAAFLIPLINRIVRTETAATRGLILTPTRELALQIDQQMTGLAYHAQVSSACIVGGLSFAEQERSIRAKADVLIVTPGRMIDHMRYDHVDFSDIEYLVLDEADRMLDMGFLPSVKQIIKELPKKRQTLLFSATFSPEIKKLTKEFQNKPVEIKIGRQIPVDAIRQRFFKVAGSAKEKLLLNLFETDAEAMKSTLIFVRTKSGVRKLDNKLYKMGVACDALHSDRDQEDRIKVLEDFRAGRIDVLVATDIASRGLDITGVSHVINFDIPANPDDYIHRVGRTARANSEGESITFVSRGDELALQRIEKALKGKIEFEPHSVKADRRSGGRGRRRKKGSRRR